MPARGVSLRPEFFDEDEGAPALEAAGAVGDALRCLMRRGEGGFFGAPDGGVEGFVAGGEDCGGCEVWFAGVG